MPLPIAEKVPLYLQFLVFKKQFLQAANTELFKPLVRIFIFCTLSTNGLRENGCVCIPSLSLFSDYLACIMMFQDFPEFQAAVGTFQ